jgi:haloacetate dehalogenase
MTVFDNFRRERINAEKAEINLVVGGSGPPVLLLHGYPQTHLMWHSVAPSLADEFTVVASDLRGYGDSSKPSSDQDHLSYSKRATAQDQVEMMQKLGFERFAVVGHDRGARVTHRMALDHGDHVTRAAVIDIVPTRAMFEATNRLIATGMYHWFFLIQPYDLPERLIGNDPIFWLRWHLKSWSRGDDSYFDPEAIAEYERCFSRPETIHASCEDYRAGASIDLRHDDEDGGRVVECPLLALWSPALEAAFEVLAEWRQRAADVRGRRLEGGHFLPEQLPHEVADELRKFLAEGGGW